MTGFLHPSPTEWTWEEGSRKRAVRVFHSTHTLVWSAWVETSEGPVFEDGARQTVEAFLAAGPPLGLSAPDELIAALRAALQADKPRKGRFCSG
jgi:hypothetical protein